MGRRIQAEPRDGRWQRALLCPAVLLLFLPRPATAQAMSEPEIKAGFLLNFTRFVDWPDTAFPTRQSPFLVCAVGSSPVTPLLAEASAGRAVDGHPIAVKTVKPTDDLRPCNLVFISTAGQKHTARIFEQLKGTHALTVGESAGFSQTGGAINFTIQENKVKLELNLNAATEANLKLSAKLIAVSRLVPSGAQSGAGAGRE